jgi:hypothetical protein
VAQQTSHLEKHDLPWPALLPCTSSCSKPYSFSACELLACALQTARQAALAAVHERREAVRQTLQLAPAPPGGLWWPCGAMLLPVTGGSLFAEYDSVAKPAWILHAFLILLRLGKNHLAV